MNKSVGLTPESRHGERGSARIKFIIVLVVVVALTYMGIQYVPVAYHAFTFRREMDATVEKAANANIPSDQKSQLAADQIRANAKDYGVPPNAKIVPAMQNGRVQVTVQFIQPINLLPGFTYQYDFDYTAKSTTVLSSN